MLRSYKRSLRWSCVIDGPVDSIRGTIVVRAEPHEQGSEAPSIFIGHGNESQAKPASAFYVANHRFGFNAPFLNEKVQVRRHAFFDLEVRRLNKQAVDADIKDSRDIVAAIANPADPNVFRGRKTR